MYILKYSKNFSLLSLFLIIFSLTLLQPFHMVNASPNLYGHSSFFRSFNNFYATSISSSTPSLTFNIITSLPNQNIIKCGLSLGDFTKSSSVKFSFKATIAYSSPTTDHFTVTLSQLQPFPINIRLYIIVIMDQGSTPMIDLTTHCLTSTNNINFFNMNQQSQSYDIDIPIETIFSDTTNIQVFAVLTSFNVQLHFTQQNIRPFIIYVDSIITSGTTAQSTYSLGAYMKLNSACMTNIFYNSSAISTTTLNGNSFYYSRNVWEMNSTVNSNMMNYPAWGPNFDVKCLIGIQYSSYMYHNQINQLLSFNANSNYYRFDSTGTVKTFLYFFCFGYGFQCGQNQGKFIDVYDNQCYNMSQCSVTPYGDYLTQFLCPKCQYKHCQQCQPLDRSICVSCDNSTHRQVDSDNCTCIAGFIDDLNTSIITCIMDCSYYLQGCDPYSCNSFTNCTMCETSLLYYLAFNSSTNTGECLLCNQTLNNCSNCASQTVCTKCQNGTYLASNNCFDCPTGPLQILNCIECQNLAGTGVCYKCDDGYSLNSGSTCDCDFTFYLANCSSCSDPITCIGCPSTYATTQVGNYVDCMLCSDLIPNCSDCSDQKTCTLCNPSLYFYFNSTSNRTQCQICSIVIQRCITCNNSTSCQVCETHFGVNGIHLCQRCDTTITNCLTCSDISVCNSCEVGYYLLNNSCHICSSISPNCLLCEVSMVGSPFCSECDNGYYLNSTGCFLCSQAMTFCLECTNSTYCDVCAAPFTFDALHSCFNCSVGIYVTGTCNNVSGCSNSVLIDGVAVCINCDTSLGFQFNQTLKKCVCQTGFKTINNTCLQVCGDNLVINMQCDDGNLISGDGCSKLCEKQPGYMCEITSSGGSNCILVQDFSIKLNYIQRVMGENAALLSFTVIPASTKLQYIDWKSVVTFNFTNSVSVSYEYSNGQLLVKVDYNSSINNQNIIMNINFDPNSIVSSPSSLSFKMVATNGPLIYENNLSNFKNLNILSLVIIGFALLQFLISTYFHKMIGLETLQCIQTIYFFRMTVTDSYGSSSIYGLNGLNFSNGFSYSSDNTNDLSAIPSFFTKLGLSLNFLDNVNIMIIPIAFTGAVYLVYKIRMLYIKQKFIQSSDKRHKDKYTILKRTSDWFYENYVFTFSILLMFTVIYSTAEQILSKSSSQQTMLTSISFGANILVLMLIVSIVCISVIDGVNKHFKNNKISKNQLQNNLDYDQNSIMSFSELYIPIYLFYYFVLTLLTLSIISDFQYVCESELGLTVTYTIMLCVWRPYVFKVHNFGIIFNQFTVVFFIFTTVLPSYISISQSGYSLMQYSTICMLMIVNIIAYLRIFIEWKTQREESQYKNKRLNNVQDQSYHRQKEDALLKNSYHNANMLGLKKQNTLSKINNQTKNKYLDQLQSYQQNIQNIQNEQTFDNNQYLSLGKLKERLRKQLKESNLQELEQ